MKAENSPPSCLCVCVCSVDTKRGQRDVHGNQTLCVREPHPPGELCEKSGRGWLESRPGEDPSLHFLLMKCLKRAVSVLTDTTGQPVQAVKVSNLPRHRSNASQAQHELQDSFTCAAKSFFDLIMK